MYCWHWCVYFQILYNAMDFYKWKFNLTSCKWIISERITEHSYWSIGVWLTCHIKFCTCDNSSPKYIWHKWACGSAIKHHSLTGLPIVIVVTWLFLLWTSITNPYVIYISPAGECTTVLRQPNNCSSLYRTKVLLKSINGLQMGA